MPSWTTILIAWRLRRRIWTKMCRAHLFEGKLDDAQLLANGIRFGKGLQLVNILRGFAGGLRKAAVICRWKNWTKPGCGRRGCCHPPTRQNSSRLSSLPRRGRIALAAGWAYTNSLAAGACACKQACAWPILIGLKTIERLRAANVLNCSSASKFPAVKCAESCCGRC